MRTLHSLPFHLLALIVLGCAGNIGSPDSDTTLESASEGDSPGTNGPSKPGNTSPEGTSDGETNTPDGKPSSTPTSGGTNSESPPSVTPDPPGAEMDCKGTPSLPNPLLRLTNNEVANSIRDMFPGIAMPEAPLAPEPSVEGFSTLAELQGVSSTAIEAYGTLAGNVATVVVANLASYADCGEPSAAGFRNCAQQFALATAATAYRHPLDADETASVTELFTQAADTWDAGKALELTLAGLLQSPEFLYRAEYRGAVDGGVATLDGYEVASRLSYLLWDTAPDAELLSAAADGKLSSALDVEAQARRLLDDPRAKDAVKAFHYQWLRMDKIQNLRRSSPVVPELSATASAALLESTEKYVDKLFWEDASLLEFLTDSRAYVNDELAPIYGVDPPGSSELVLTDVDPMQRSGVLTQAGLLSGFAHELTDSPVLRGVFVLDRFLCTAPPPPPEGIPTSPNLELAQNAKTTRQKMEQGHSLSACLGCHAAIDGIGFAFGHYDAVGAWRDEEGGEPVDVSGALVNTVDVDGEVNGALELGARLAESRQVRACIAQQWYRYGLGLSKAEVDPCALEPVVQAFADGDTSLKELLVSLVVSDAFRKRSVQATEETP